MHSTQILFKILFLNKKFRYSTYQLNWNINWHVSCDTNGHAVWQGFLRNS